MPTSKLLGRVGALRRLPVGRLLAAAEIVLLAREHFQKLAPDERRRFVHLMARGRGRPSKLTAGERAELTMLVLKADPRQFARLAVHRLSPIPVPDPKPRRKR